MADQTLNRFLASGTEAARLAFTPDPPAPASGPDPAYVWHETDTGRTYVYAASAWALVGDPAEAPPPAPPGATPTTWLVSGGQVVWESGYTFRVSAAVYYLAGTRYESSETTVTLGAADATLDRLDVIALDASGATSIAGTAAATPSEPTVDPAQYVKLALVLVTHATTAPAELDSIPVYAENAGTPSEWAWASSGASIVVNSTTNPHAGTTCIEGTNVVAGVYAQGTASAPIDPTDYDHLLLFLRSKAAWNSSRGLLVTLRSGGVLVGAAAQLRRTGTYGFDSTVTSGYQMIAIPIVAFAVPQGSTIDQVRVEDFGGAIGFYLDDVSFQVGATTPVGGGFTQDQADARYAPLVHAPRHQSGGGDAIKLDDLSAPDDTTDLNASASAHGLLRKLSGSSGDVLRGDGTWGAAGTPGAHASSHQSGGGDAIKLDDLSAPDDTTDLNASASAHGLLRKLSGSSGDVLRGDGTWGSAGTPGSHASSHQSGGGDAIKLDDLSAPDDNTDLNASASAHGLLPKLPGTTTTFLRGDGAWAAPAATGALSFVVGTGSGTISTGAQPDLYLIPFACTITKVTVMSVDASITSGSIVIDVWKDSYANSPPTVADTITASAKPTLSSATKSQDSTLTGWTTAIAADDVLRLNVDSVTSLTKVRITFTVTR